jgi:hypothetical protein
VLPRKVHASQQCLETRVRSKRIEPRLHRQRHQIERRTLDVSAFEPVKRELLVAQSGLHQRDAVRRWGRLRLQRGQCLQRFARLTGDGSKMREIRYCYAALGKVHRSLKCLGGLTEHPLLLESKPEAEVSESQGWLHFDQPLQLPGLDYRDARSPVTPWVSILGNVVILLSCLFIFWVTRVNSFAASNVRVEKDQRVIDTGRTRTCAIPCTPSGSSWGCRSRSVRGGRSGSSWPSCPCSCGGFSTMSES